MSEINHQILLASRPQGAASADNFRLVEAQIPPLAESEVRVATTSCRSTPTCAAG